jgi:hypothetical protein
VVRARLEEIGHRAARRTGHDRDGPDYVLPSERIAIYDNDGTLWCEKPMPIELGIHPECGFARWRTKKSPSAREPWRAVYEKYYAWLGGAINKHFGGDDGDLELLMGGLLESFRRPETSSTARAQSTASSVPTHPTRGLSFHKCGYVPMIEREGAHHRRCPPASTMNSQLVGRARAHPWRIVFAGTAPVASEVLGPAHTEGGVHPRSTGLSFEAFGRHRGGANSSDSCDFRRPGTAGGDTGPTLVMTNVSDVSVWERRSNRLVSRGSRVSVVTALARHVPSPVPPQTQKYLTFQPGSNPSRPMHEQPDAGAARTFVARLFLRRCSFADRDELLDDDVDRLRRIYLV